MIACSQALSSFDIFDLKQAVQHLPGLLSSPSQDLREEVDITEWGSDGLQLPALQPNATHANKYENATKVQSHSTVACPGALVHINTD
jgi:hypothetical protein